LSIEAKAKTMPASAGHAARKGTPLFNLSGFPSRRAGGESAPGARRLACTDSDDSTP
jgi:hypothetical protein